MRRFVVAFVVGLVITGGSWAEIKVTLKSPQITSVTIGTHTLTSTELSTFQSNIDSAVGTLQDILNKSSFGKFTLSELGKGFANANAAAFDAATLFAYQNYDSYAVTVGTDLGLAAPAITADAFKASIADDLQAKGDSYFGFGQGGAAVQAGMNTSWIIPNTRISAKLGVVPTIAADESMTSTSGYSLGLGATYTILSKSELLAGLLSWRGLVVGSGVVYGTSNMDMTVSIKNPDSQDVSTGTAGGQVNAKVTLDKVKAKLSLTNNYLIVPIEASTSLQAFSFFNFGVGLGLDVALINTTSIKVGTDANWGLTTSSGSTTISSTSGSASVSGDVAKSNGDFLMPRVSASVGFNVSIVHIEVPLAYYPLNKAASVGINLGVDW